MSAAAPGEALALERIRQLEEGAPRLYARWSGRAWRAVCEGPAMRLWDSLVGTPGAEAALEDYLLLAREAVGLRYLAASEPADLSPGAARGFLAEALCDTAPRLLAAVPSEARAAALARLWNAGEKLVAGPAWLDRYLAARLPELDALDGLEAFLERVLAEGLDDGPRADWAGPFACSVVDPSAADPLFLPGVMHLATPAIVCVHDRRREGRHVAVLLRRRAAGGPLCLGATGCLAGAGGQAPPAPAAAGAHALPSTPQQAVLDAAGVEDATEVLATTSGFAAVAAALSQRIRVVESAS